MSNWVKAFLVWFQIRVTGEPMVVVVERADNTDDVRYRLIGHHKGKIFFTWCKEAIERALNDETRLARSCYSRHTTLIRNIKAMYDYDQKNGLSIELMISVTGFIENKEVIC